MNGYKLSGSITLYDSYVQGYTYCEDINAKKNAYTLFKYMSTSGVEHTDDSGTQSPYSNNAYDMSEIVSADSNFYYYLGAMTHSKVQMSESYYYWESEGTDTELRMGYYAR